MKKAVRMIHILMVLCMLLAASPACSGSENGAEEGVKKIEPIPTVSADVSGSTHEPPPGTEKILSANSLILTVDTKPVYWPEFRFWLNYIVKYYKKARGIDKIMDWNETQNGMPLKEFFLSTAVGYARKDRAIEAKAKELGIGLSQEDLTEIEEKRKSNIRIYGSESEYRRIVASMYVTEEVFNYLTKIDYLGNDLFEYFYGKTGEKFSDESVLDFIHERGYVCAKYIFLSNTDAEGNEQNLKKRKDNLERLSNILDRLNASETPLELFDEMMKDYSEDTTISKYPDGRLLAPIVKGEVFEKACQGLEENEYSGIVTTDDGSYIILRMPISPNMTADAAGNKLTYWAAYESFKNRVEGWSMNMKVVYEAAYFKFDLENLF